MSPQFHKIVGSASIILNLGMINLFRCLYIGVTAVMQWIWFHLYKEYLQQSVSSHFLVCRFIRMLGNYTVKSTFSHDFHLMKNLCFSWKERTDLGPNAGKKRNAEQLLGLAFWIYSVQNACQISGLLTPDGYKNQSKLITLENFKYFYEFCTFKSILSIPS